MNETGYKDEALTAYLLGTLPADEAEHFDELSITDGEFFSALNAAENDLVDAYVNGDLTGLSRSQFEANFLATPRRREKLKFATNFNRYTEESRNTPATSIGSATDSVEGTGLLASIKSLFSIRLASAAAMLAIVAIGGWFILRDRGSDSGQIAQQGNTQDQISANTPNRMEAPVVDNSQPPLEREVVNGFSNAGSRQNSNEKAPPKPPERNAIVALILSPPVRGTGAKTLNIPDGASQVSVRLELESDEFNNFRVVLRDQSTKSEPWSSGPIKAVGKTGQKTLGLNIPAKLLKPGVYSLNVSGVSPDGSREIVGDYLFRVVR